MASDLDRARQSLHGHLRNQALDRAMKTISGAHSNFLQVLHPSHGIPGFGQAQVDHAEGNNAAGAQAWLQHHTGNALQHMPGWVSRQLVGSMGHLGGGTGFPTMPGGVLPPGGDFRGHPGSGPAVPATGLPAGQGQSPVAAGSPNGAVPNAPMVPSPTAVPSPAVHAPAPAPSPVAPNATGLNRSPVGLIHLGGGLFVHPTTGEIHGFPGGSVGVHFPPSPAAPAPGMARPY